MNISDNICIDVSHMSCEKERVKINFKACKSYDPDYLMLEVHPNPKEAKSDSKQQLSFKEFKELL